MSDELINRTVARRRLLGKAGAVAATVAGAGAVSAAMASPADAAAGDNLKIGQTNNDAGSQQTSLTSSGLTTLTLGNTGTSAGPAGKTKAAPALQLVPAADYAQGPLGSLGVSSDGVLWSTGHDADLGGDGLFADYVRTGANTTIVYPFAPVRVLDTRPGQPFKDGMLNPSVVSQGFIANGATLHLNLDSLLNWAWAIFANITVVAGGQAGYVTAFPSGKDVPVSSNVNFTPGAIVSNFAAIAVGSFGTPPNAGSAYNAIDIFAHGAAAVIVDIAAAVVNYPSDVKGGGSGAAIGADGLKRPGVVADTVRRRPPGI